MFSRNIAKYSNFARKYGVRSYSTPKSSEVGDAAFKPIPTLEEGKQRRKFVWNGKTYNYPWQGALVEDYSPEMWKKLKDEGIITAGGRLKHWKIKDKMQRMKIQQIWYQMNDGKPIYLKGYFDDAIMAFLAVVIVATTACLAYWSYIIWTNPKPKK